MDVYEESNESEYSSTDTKDQTTVNNAEGDRKSKLSINQIQRISNSKVCLYCKNTQDAVYNVDKDAFMKLKDSTRKLLSVIEVIQSKTHAKHCCLEYKSRVGKKTQPISRYEEFQASRSDIMGQNVLKQLETQTTALQSVYIEDTDDCSIYKRLTRRCHCLNQEEYNDLIIHFNENTKWSTNNIGEIIKNMRIVKKFLYMGLNYTKNTLQFLNEGLSKSTYNEKVEMVQGISYADLCNVFEDHSIVIINISWPCKYKYFGDAQTQNMTAKLLNNIAQLEEGRRYLTYSYKITNDIRKVIRKRASKLDYHTLETLNSTLNLLHPPLETQMNVQYYCKAIDEGLGYKAIQALTQLREYMTMEEVKTHLELLNNISGRDTGKIELTPSLPALLSLFKTMLLEYDNSEINILITNVLNNVVFEKNVHDKEEANAPRTMMIADVATEPIMMKNGSNQVPIKNSNKKHSKTKSRLASKSKQRQKTVKEEEQLTRSSRKITNIDDRRSKIITVPLERK